MRQEFSTNLAMAMGPWTVTELARELGVDVSTVSHWLHGRKVPSLERATALARLLGVSLDALVACK